MSSRSTTNGSAVLRANAHDEQLLLDRAYYQLDIEPNTLTPLSASALSPAHSTAMALPFSRLLVGLLPLYGQGRAVGRAIVRELEAAEREEMEEMTQEDEEVMCVLLAWLATLCGIMVFVCILAFVYATAEVQPAE